MRGLAGATELLTLMGEPRWRVKRQSDPKSFAVCWSADTGWMTGGITPWRWIKTKHRCGWMNEPRAPAVLQCDRAGGAGASDRSLPRSCVFRLGDSYASVEERNLQPSQ